MINRSDQHEKAATTENRIPMGRIGDRPLWILNLTLLVRAAHQVGVAVFLTFFLIEPVSRPPAFYLWLAVISGALLTFSEWLRHRQIFREVAGTVSLAKIFLLGAAFHHYLPPQATVLLVFLLAAVAAHAPKKVRHRLLY